MSKGRREDDGLVYYWEDWELVLKDDDDNDIYYNGVDMTDAVQRFYVYEAIAEKFIHISAYIMDYGRQA